MSLSPKARKQPAAFCSACPKRLQTKERQSWNTCWVIWRAVNHCSKGAAGKSPGRRGTLGCPVSGRVPVSSRRCPRWGKGRGKRPRVVLGSSQHRPDVLIQLPAPASHPQAALEHGKLQDVTELLRGPLNAPRLISRELNSSLTHHSWRAYTLEQLIRPRDHQLLLLNRQTRSRN